MKTFHNGFQVLSMLVAQSAMSRAGGKPFLAVNHIRDQLIPPQERKKKAKVWSKVVDYIRYLLRLTRFCEYSLHWVLRLASVTGFEVVKPSENPLNLATTIRFSDLDPYDGG